jgi:hypothetical protein
MNIATSSWLFFCLFLIASATYSMRVDDLSHNSIEMTEFVSYLDNTDDLEELPEQDCFNKIVVIGNKQEHENFIKILKEKHRVTTVNDLEYLTISLLIINDKNKTYYTYIWQQSLDWFFIMHPQEKSFSQMLQILLLPILKESFGLIILYDELTLKSKKRTSVLHKAITPTNKNLHYIAIENTSDIKLKKDFILNFLKSNN